MGRRTAWQRLIGKMWPAAGKKVGKPAQLSLSQQLKTCSLFFQSKDSNLRLRCDQRDALQAPSLQTKPQVFSHHRPDSFPPAVVRHTPGQEGIMPLFLFRSAIVRRLWLDTRLLLASFLRRSRAVSSVCPWPFGLPTTLLERSGRKLERENKDKRWWLNQKAGVRRAGFVIVTN